MTYCGIKIEEKNILTFTQASLWQLRLRMDEHQIEIGFRPPVEKVDPRCLRKAV